MKQDEREMQRGHRRPTVVIATAAFEPGFKGGGPIRSVANLARALNERFIIRIVTRDRDIGDSRQYDGIKSGRWLRWNRVAISYCSGMASLTAGLRSALRSGSSTVLYLNSVFHPRFSIFPLALDLLGVIYPTAIVVAPRGEFSSGALAIRSLRKKVFLAIARVTGFHRRVTWHATTPSEVDDIRRTIGQRVRIVVARNLTTVEPWVSGSSLAGDCRSLLRIVFLSRIAEKKNLLYAIRVLQLVTVPVEFRIAGPVEDKAYWKRCERELQLLPANVRPILVGPVMSGDVQGELSKSHLFFLPTFGENYGHAIVEALLAGVPVLISDQTPWQGLQEHGAGWSLGLDNPTAFVDVIEKCARLNPEQYDRFRTCARMYAEAELQKGAYQESIDMFAGCLKEASSGSVNSK